ncbi:ActS/PrrB/RegB family redox-sensitive histidine kinase [Martelella lutilitoris]|uniref:histidine kinase n=1 Tax=Martelella lutilitoris TaxID=2583532 RepID=A0A7T7HKA5_9HYPH|nr:ActS/PrrB/RegB family redox-sensitive histidine kinase [Martelella lutilitoris]QQM30748.1 ActS/PrrB/RegB family redox-sensitive histidine kinase [Martelella lutilitoris]
MNKPVTDMVGHERRGNLRLQTLVRLRWLAVAGQTAAALTVAFGLDFPMPIIPVLALIAALALGNLVLSVSFPATQRVSPRIAFAMIGFDLLQLTALLYLTGGLANPFAPLICVPVIISFAALPLHYAFALLAFAVSGVSALALSPFPLPWHAGITLEIEPILKFGIWIAIIAMLGFAAFYVQRITLEAQQISDALAATELVLQREQHLSQLDGLAAAAAHELGTPLATISVVAKEMARALGDDPEHGEDVQLLVSQSQRCRDILSRLTSLSKEDEAHMRLLPLTSLIEEVVAPHRPFVSKMEIRVSGEAGGEPVGNRNPGILYGLGNIIENAVEHARQKVEIAAHYSETRITITVTDDGGGYTPDILPRIGDPFVSDRQKNPADSRAGGLGLGLFIAKTLLERSGARLSFENVGGARITVSWPRWRMEADMADQS